MFCYIFQYQELIYFRSAVQRFVPPGSKYLIEDIPCTSFGKRVLQRIRKVDG